MERQTALAEVIDTVADKAKYDRCAKKLLSFKAIDAWILKYCTQEFSLYSIEYIMEHCMSDKVEVSEHAVHQDELNRKQEVNGDKQITKLNSESSSINEGTVYFDVRFNATIPGTKEPIMLIINLEIQTKDKPGYELVTRGIYYCGRMISEQYGTVFTNEHYEKIQKVYSIWICPTKAKSRKNGISRYHMIEDSVLGGEHLEQNKYDLMEVVIVNLGDAEYDAELGILDLLNTLFSPKIEVNQKKKVLSEKYSIAMTAELESEVQYMCNLSTAIANEAARDNSLETAKSLLVIGKLTYEEIAQATKLTVDEVKELDKKRSA